jgi:hypothetical protein
MSSGLPGSSCGQYGEGYLWLSYTTSTDNITAGIERVRKALGKLTPTI